MLFPAFAWPSHETKGICLLNQKVLHCLCIFPWSWRYFFSFQSAPTNVAWDLSDVPKSLIDGRHLDRCNLSDTDLGVLESSKVGMKTPLFRLLGSQGNMIENQVEQKRLIFIVGLVNNYYCRSIKWICQSQTHTQAFNMNYHGFVQGAVAKNNCLHQWTCLQPLGTIVQEGVDVWMCLFQTWQNVMWLSIEDWYPNIGHPNSKEISKPGQTVQLQTLAPWHRPGAEKVHPLATGGGRCDTQICWMEQWTLSHLKIQCDSFFSPNGSWKQIRDRLSHEIWHSTCGPWTKSAEHITWEEDFQDETSEVKEERARRRHWSPSDEHRWSVESQQPPFVMENVLTVWWFNHKWTFLVEMVAILMDFVTFSKAELWDGGGIFAPLPRKRQGEEGTCQYHAHDSMMCSAQWTLHGFFCCGRDWSRMREKNQWSVWDHRENLHESLFIVSNMPLNLVQVLGCWNKRIHLCRYIVLQFCLHPLPTLFGWRVCWNLEDLEKSPGDRALWAMHEQASEAWPCWKGNIILQRSNQGNILWHWQIVFGGTKADFGFLDPSRMENCWKSKSMRSLGFDLFGQALLEAMEDCVWNDVGASCYGWSE